MFDDLRDGDLVDLYKKGQIALSELPPHLKWELPKKVYTVDAPYRDPGTDFRDDPGMTDPSQKEDCDVNLIIKRATQTGVLPGVDVKSVFADISEVPDYMEARQLVINAENQFASLDAHVRKKFDNEPAKFLAFMGDPKNAKEAVELGLMAIAPKSMEQQLLDEMRESNKIARERDRPKPPRQPSKKDDDAE